MYSLVHLEDAEAYKRCSDLNHVGIPPPGSLMQLEMVPFCIWHLPEGANRVAVHPT